MLEYLCRSVDHALNATDLCLLLKKFADWLEFENSSLSLKVEHADGISYGTVFNLPKTYLPIFDSSQPLDSAFQPLDPVMRHCRQSNLPLIWNQSTYVRDGMGEHWEAQAPFGMQVGLMLVVHLPGGLHVNMGIERSGQLPRTSAQIRKVLAAAQLFFAHASPAALRVLGSEVIRGASLTAGESRMLAALGERVSGEDFTDHRRGSGFGSSLQRLTDGVNAIERIQILKQEALSVAQKMRLVSRLKHRMYSPE